MLGKRGCSLEVLVEEGIEPGLAPSLGERSLAARKTTAVHKVTPARVLLHPSTDPCACRDADTQSTHLDAGIRDLRYFVLTSLIISGVTDLPTFLRPLTLALAKKTGPTSPGPSSNASDGGETEWLSQDPDSANHADAGILILCYPYEVGRPRRFPLHIIPASRIDVDSLWRFPHLALLLTRLREHHVNVLHPPQPFRRLSHCHSVRSRSSSTS